MNLFSSSPASNYFRLFFAVLFLGLMLGVGLNSPLTRSLVPDDSAESLLKGGSGDSVKVNFDLFSYKRIRRLITETEGLQISRDMQYLIFKPGAVDPIMREFLMDILMSDRLADRDYIPIHSRLRYNYLEFVRNMLPLHHPQVGTYTYASEENFRMRDRVLAPLIVGVDRNSAQLERVWEKYKGIFFAIIRRELYQNSWMEGYVRTLIETYEHFMIRDDFPRILTELYEELIMQDENEITYENYSSLTERHSEIMLPYLMRNTMKTLGLDGEDTRGPAQYLPKEIAYPDVTWFHTFWVRRHHEGNAKSVYRILFEIFRHYGGQR